VLSARGMAGWMRAFGEFAVPAPGGTAVAASLSSAESLRSPAGQPVPLHDADQVVAVLTQMVLPLAA